MPPRRAQIVQVGKRQLELSNLSRVLYPDDHITKAQVLDYYLKTAPTLLAHGKERPLSLLRFPDGIKGERFFQKNRPEWAPEWLAHVILGEQQIDYVLATEEASLVWLANLACLELHQMHSRAPHFDKPDYIVYDFDPPEGFAFHAVAELALDFKKHVEQFGYNVFVKTTGRKGLHVVTPIEPKWDFHTVFEAARAVAQPFVDSHATALTLQIKKEHRKGKVLLDIYRNRFAQTIIAAYSLRGVPGAPVSTPLQWEELDTLIEPGSLHLHNIPERITAKGDPWEAIAAYATAIHTQAKTPTPPKKLNRSRTHKTPEQLLNYSRKRSFDATPEPPPVPLSASGSAFVVHRHHASRLHYDLRLERGGVLRSWAVPKGLPPRPGIMRLAVNVEDHPLDYVNFEGVIPKGQYGGGSMWKFAKGRYEISREKKDGFYFRLHSPELNGEYRIHHTKENQWLLERVDTAQVDWLSPAIEPMLSRSANRPPDSPDYLFEVKWDGLRALVSLDEGTVKLRGRNGLELTKQFPELVVPDALRATSGLFDGELVCVDSEGKPGFSNVISRMQQTAPSAIERARAKNPAICYLFDCLYLDGRPIVNEPLSRRREWLADVVKTGTVYRVSETFEDGSSLLEAVRQMGLEGIMAKQRNSVYAPGKRSESWLKIKTRQTVECVIVGYTIGEGGRQTEFGALHLAQPGPQGLRYVGKVGTGFPEEVMTTILKELKKLTPADRPAITMAPRSPRSVWVEPKLVCEVQYASVTPDGMLREPVFKRLRPDLTREIDA